ncbi:SDR family oxidoreductase [Shouchella sp. 1P09AA]|uniref:SDR family NAD(P)-dependent oxidoreductase n=1 Tax=unclassified Shouchella TaxID=2893065 RepID=UPI0039A3F25E
MVFANDVLQDKHILVTGATGGIGAATAKTLTKLGANVTVTGRNEEKLNALQKEYQDILIVPADLNVEDERNQLVEKAIKKHGPIFGLVNSAGMSGGAIVEELDEETMTSIMHTNFTSLILLTQKVYQSMKQEQEGAVVNVSSLSGLRGTYGNSAYAGSKFALIGFTQSFALEAIENQVRVNAVCPGFVNTEMGKGAIERKAKQNGRSYEEQLNEVEQNLPSGRITEPEEVANTIIYLLTDAAKNIVGESVKISGGSVMR